MTFGLWDIALIIAVTLQVAVVAYVYDPRWKAFVLMLPIPFTLATLAVGKPVDATNVLGVIVLLLFTNAVRWLHYDAGWRIVLSIILSAIGCCLIATFVAPHVGGDNLTFWICSAAVVVLAVVVLFNSPHVIERGHRTPLPIYIKLPGIAVMVTLLVILKKPLGGFMTAFPMVTVFAAYESRHSLSTLCRQMPVIMLILLAVMITMRLTQATLGMAGALAAAWGVFLLLLAPMNRLMRPPLPIAAANGGARSSTDPYSEPQTIARD